jgi:hypothetical protein
MDKATGAETKDTSVSIRNLAFLALWIDVFDRG